MKMLWKGRVEIERETDRQTGHVKEGDISGVIRNRKMILSSH